MKVRLHPRGGGAPWRDLARTDPALDLRPGDESLEQALDFIEDDELAEITPNHIRLRKKLLTETERKRASR